VRGDESRLASTSTEFLASIDRAAGLRRHAASFSARTSELFSMTIFPPRIEIVPGASPVLFTSSERL
jgi:hypothetical protein